MKRLLIITFVIITFLGCEEEPITGSGTLSLDNTTGDSIYVTFSSISGDETEFSGMANETIAANGSHAWTIGWEIEDSDSSNSVMFIISVNGGAGDYVNMSDGESISLTWD